MFARAPTVTSKASVKIVVDDEPRRVGSDYFDYNDVKKFWKQLEQLYSKEGLYDALQQHRYVITYEDSEGDRIPISTTAELQESVRSQSNKSQSTPVLRYNVERNKSHTAQPPIVNTTEPKDAQPPQTQPQLPDETEEVVTLQEDEEQQPLLQPAVPVSPVQTPMIWTLDQLNAAALEYLEKKDYPNARQTYHKAVQLHPQNHVLWYNLSCVESLAGDLVGAWAALEQAILTGYRNWQHLLTDEDLKALRNDWSCFQHVHRMMQYYGYEEHQTPKEASPVIPAPQPVTATTAEPVTMDVDMGETQQPTTTKHDQDHDAIIVDDEPAVRSSVSRVPPQYQQEALQLEEMGIPADVIPVLLEHSKGNIANALDYFYGMQ